MKNILHAPVFSIIALIFFSSSAGAISKNISEEDRQACLGCHAVANQENNSNIRKDQIKGPQLGGLTKDYILQQLFNYQEGRRNTGSDASKVMTDAVKDFKPEKIHALAKWASRLNSKKIFDYDTGKEQFGQKIYIEKCKGCHDSFMGRTMTGSPTLSYLTSDYMIKQLSYFSLDQRNFKNPNKHQIKMKSIVKGLTEIEFQLLSTFIKDTAVDNVIEATQ